jgi:hypothetical protein
MCIENGYIAADLDVDALDVGKFIIETPEYSAEYVTKKTYLMNLDVNFVNNRRMSRGEYEISVRAFLDVIRRYDGHAFAYYYLALALQGCKADGCAVETARNRCKEIAAKEATWREYFDYFGIRI